jgi:rhodanese-related sulfurtransferase
MQEHNHRSKLSAKVAQVNATHPSTVQVMTPEELRRMQKDGVSFILVDCRTEQERRVSGIDCEALSIEEFEENIDEIVATDDVLVVCHCTVGSRSGRFVVKHQNNVPRMYNLSGGILGWVDCGYEIWKPSATLDGQQATKDLHVCCKSFLPLAPSEYTCFYFEEDVDVPYHKRVFRWVTLSPRSSSWDSKKTVCAH